MLITEEEIENRHIKTIKSAYKVNFERDITEEEIKEVLTHLLPRMENDLKETKGFSDAEFERYMSSGNNDLLFSPACIISEVIRATQNITQEEFLKPGKYKRLKEMEIAARYCFANFKTTNQVLMVRGQDNPDIVLVSIGDSSSKSIRSARLEVMNIPEIAKEKLGADLPTSIAKFIEEKKFSKDYGGICSLIVGLDFTQQNLNFEKIAEEIKSLPKNPYHSIYLTFVSTEDGKTMTVIQIYPPGSVKIEYNLEKEPNLIY